MAPNAELAKDGPLSMMEKLSPIISIYRPPSASLSRSSTASPSPKLIVMLAWMDARDIHIAKYTTQYQAMYPDAQILLIKCEQGHVMKPAKGLRDIQPAVPAIRAAMGSSSSKKPELLVHEFSNGGLVMLKHLYAVYRQQVEADGRLGDSPLLPPHVTVYDSAPGYFSYRRSLLAMNIGQPMIIRLLLAPYIHTILIFWWLWVRVFRRTDPLQRNAAAHNEKTKNATEARRAYIYSKEDKLVDWRSVEHHAGDAKAKGFDVRMERFEGSAHVAHARVDQERYWRIISEVWEGTN